MNHPGSPGNSELDSTKRGYVGNKHRHWFNVERGLQNRAKRYGDLAIALGLARAVSTLCLLKFVSKLTGFSILYKIRLRSLKLR